MIRRNFGILWLTNRKPPNSASYFLPATLGGFRKYIAEIPAFIAKHSGKYLVRGVRPTTIEGDWKPEYLVIIEFPERGKAEEFLNDPEIQDLFMVHHDTTTSKLVLADGCA